jgi:hypothetical protein
VGAIFAHVVESSYLETREGLFFAVIGLSDAVIAEIANRDLLVMTTDGPLYHYLQTIGLPVLNFNHIRTLYWT